MSKLHEMELHDVLHPSGNAYNEIMRVPGGWLYRVYQEAGSQHEYRLTQTFVPYSDEFKEVDGESCGRGNTTQSRTNSSAGSTETSGIS